MNKEQVVRILNLIERSGIYDEIEVNKDGLSVTISEKGEKIIEEMRENYPEVLAMFRSFDRPADIQKTYEDEWT